MIQCVVCKNQNMKIVLSKVNEMIDQLNLQLFNGFIEAMYFADGTDSEFKDENGFYLDGKFDKSLELSEQAKEGIKTLIQQCLSKIPKNVMDELLNEMTLDSIGCNIYFEVMGHGTGFEDRTLSNEAKEFLFSAFYNTFICDVYDDGDNVHFTYKINK